MMKHLKKSFELQFLDLAKTVPELQNKSKNELEKLAKEFAIWRYEKITEEFIKEKINFGK